MDYFTTKITKLSLNRLTWNIYRALTVAIKTAPVSGAAPTEMLGQSPGPISQGITFYLMPEKDKVKNRSLIIPLMHLVTRITPIKYWKRLSY